MKVGDLVGDRCYGSLHNTQDHRVRLGVVTKKGGSKYFVSWLDGQSDWRVSSLLEVVNEDR